MRQASTDKQLTGRHVLLMVMAFFGVLILINGIFIYQAVGTFRGEDVERSYRQGLDYNETLAARREQSELGWRAQVEVKQVAGAKNDRDIQVVLKDKSGLPIVFDRLEGRLRHPVDTELDIPIEFKPSNASSLKISIPAGRWILIATAQKNGDSFTFRKTLSFE